MAKEKTNTNRNEVHLATGIGIVIMPSYLYEIYLQNYDSEQELSNLFNSKGIDRYTHFEHTAMGGSALEFFNNPFMGGYSRDEGVIQEAKKRRREECLRKPRLSKIGLVLLVNNPDFNVERRMEFTYWNSVYQVEKLFDQSRAKLFFRELYERNTGRPQTQDNFDGIDYIRVDLVPKQYDKSLMAIPNPISLGFIVGGNVVAKIEDRQVLDRVKIRKQDVKVSDVIIDSNGDKHYIKMATKSGNHRLKEISETPFWFENYYRRIFM